ncbi:MAG: signal peptidase II [Rhodoglobus sp.]
MLSIVAVLVYIFDRVSKFFVTQDLELGSTVDFVGKILQLHYVENSGAAFSLASGTTWLFAIIASAVAVFIVIFARRIRSKAWAVLFGLLLGGTLGNLTDRLTRGESFGQGYVVDFLQLIYFPWIFNIADTAIVSSMALFIILTIRGIGLDGKRTLREPKVADPAATDPS